MTWSTFSNAEHDEWAIRDFTALSTTVTILVALEPNTRKTFSDCTVCSNGKHYATYQEAINHLHTEHLQCPDQSKSERLCDDPCFVWLQRIPRAAGGQEAWEEVMLIAEEFTISLMDISKLVNDVHCLVATVSGGTDGGGARPPLTSNLVYAFVEILCVYLMEAKHLSMTNRAVALSSSENPDKTRLNHYHDRIFDIKCRRNEALHKANELLIAAKKDVILTGTRTRNLDAVVGLEAIGPEFLVTALLSNLQNREIMPDIHVDIVKLYQGYMSKLLFQANRRPQRRVFLDIHALEEELTALRVVVSSQGRLLINLRKLLSPNSFRVTNTTRQGLFKVESKYIDAQIRKLRARDEDLKTLQWKSQALKEQVKQTIEVLEEGHGKAIRVFTIVTLFFLPL